MKNLTLILLVLVLVFSSLFTGSGCANTKVNLLAIQQLDKDALRTDHLYFNPQMIIKDRHYEMLGFLRGDEKSVGSQTMIWRAKEMSAHLGEDDGQYLLDNQQDIPIIYRGKKVFVFTDWRHPIYSDYVYYVYWDESSQHWIRHWSWLIYGDWYDDDWVLRRLP